MPIRSDPDMEDTVMPLTRACIPLRSTQLETLRHISKDTGAPVSELIRRAIDSYLAARLADYVPGAGLPASGQDQPVPFS
jgi:hypothetical protein